MTRKLKALGIAMVAAFAFSALAASAAQAEIPTHFAADDYPASVTTNAKGTQTFVTAGGTKLTCEEVGGKAPATGTATLNGPDPSLTVTGPNSEGDVIWHNCHATVLKIPVTVDMNGCDLTFTSGTTTTPGTSTGTVHIVNCDNATAGITITIGAEGKTCHIDVPEQTPNSGSVTYHNVEIPGTGKEGVTATVENVNVDIDYTGGTQSAICGGSEAKTDKAVPSTATYNGNATGTGKNQAGEDTDVTVVDTIE